MIYKNTRYRNKHHMTTQLLISSAGIKGHMDTEVLQALYNTYKETLYRAYGRIQPLSFNAWKNSSLGTGIPVDE